METQMNEIPTDELMDIDGGADWCTGFINCLGKSAETVGHAAGEFVVGFVCYFADC